jgi:hypothetical protein
MGGGKHKKWWRTHWSWRKEVIGIVGKEENFSISHETFPSMSGWHSTIVESGYTSWFCLLRFITRLLDPTRSDAQTGKELSLSNSNVKDNILYQGKTSKLNLHSLGWWNRMDTQKARVRSWWHGSKVGQHHVGYLLKINDTQTLIGQMVDVCETTMIWLDNKCESRGTLGWEWTIYNIT